MTGKAPWEKSLFALRRHLKQSRKQLDKMLSCAQPVPFLKLIWSLDAISRGEVPLGLRYGPAFTSDELSKAREHFVFNGWTLETLLNEFLVSDQPFKPERNGGVRILDVRKANTAFLLLKAMRDLENAEDGLWLKTRNVIDYMGHLAQRQFPWQRGIGRFLDFYRSQFLFDFPEAHERFQARTGMSMAEFVRCGFAIFAQASNTPFTCSTINMRPIEIDRAIVEKTLTILAKPLSELKTQAHKTRAVGSLTAYKPSIFRLHPCITLQGDDTFIAPLPELVCERISNGLFYDVVGEPGAIQEIVGKRFEAYISLMFQTHLPELAVLPEEKYSPKKGLNFATPDLRLAYGGECFAVVECKAARAPYGARFADDPASISGLDSMAHGIFQLWRYFSHQRRCLAPSAGLTEEACGIVLTLDTWLDMHSAGQEEAFKLAHEIRGQRDGEIQDIDCRPVGFLHVQDFEGVLATATPLSFARAVQDWQRKPEFSGWSLKSVHDRQSDRRDPRDRYDLDALPKPTGLAWWDLIGGKERQK